MGKDKTMEDFEIALQTKRDLLIVWEHYNMAPGYRNEPQEYPCIIKKQGYFMNFIYMNDFQKSFGKTSDIIHQYHNIPDNLLPEYIFSHKDMFKKVKFLNDLDKYILDNKFLMSADFIQTITDSITEEIIKLKFEFDELTNELVKSKYLKK